MQEFFPRSLSESRLDDKHMTTLFQTTPTKSESLPAVLPTESIHVTIENAPKKNQNGSEQRKTSQPAVINVGDSPGPVMRTVELSPTERITEGFGNENFVGILITD